MKYAKVYLEDVEIGAEMPPLVKGPIEQIQLTRYAGASGDFNPIHWNDRTARAVGLPGVIAHGMLTMALAGRAVTEWAGDPGRVQEYGVRRGWLRTRRPLNEVVQGRVDGEQVALRLEESATRTALHVIFLVPCDDQRWQRPIGPVRFSL